MENYRNNKTEENNALIDRLDNKDYRTIIEEKIRNHKLK
jgi:hypothetical protein